MKQPQKLFKYLFIIMIMGISLWIGLGPEMEVHAATLNESTPINQLFPDPVLAEKIRSTTAKPSVGSAVTQSDLNKVTYVNIQGYGKEPIKSIEGMQYLNELSYLSLDGNQVSDLTPLANATKLTYLTLSDNNVSDVSSLKNLSKVYLIGLKNNQVEDISSLSNLTALKYLYLNGNKLSDLSAIANLTTLDILEVKNQQVTKQSVAFQNNLVLPNTIKDTKGASIAPTNISNNGTYSNNSLNWSLPELTNEVTYSFSQTVTAGSKISTEFSGTVTQPIHETIYHTATFDVDGVQINDTKEISTLIEEPPAPTKEGYTFIGWFDEEGNEWDFSTDKMPEKDLTLYARFDKDTSEVVVPEEETETPAEEVEVPEEETETPAEEVEVPEEETETPAEEVEAPEEETETPAEEVEVPEEETETPAEEVEVPEEDTETPAEEVEVPEEETETPAEEVEVPEEGTETPAEEVEVPEEDAETPSEEVEVPEEDAETPSEEVEVPEEGTETPAEEVEVPEEDAETPSEEVEVPEEETETPAEEVEVPAEDIETPSEEVEVPAEDIETPSEEVEVPEEDTETPAEEVEVPAEDIETPAEEVEVPEKDTETPTKKMVASKQVLEISAEPTTLIENTEILEAISSDVVEEPIENNKKAVKSINLNADSSKSQENTKDDSDYEEVKSNKVAENKKVSTQTSSFLPIIGDSQNFWFSLMGMIIMALSLVFGRKKRL
ncbi:InlB B-repeat-containing protein [Listeria welshimeri]|uniref:Ig-like domain-containing protein n=1 Tax=Listeria welshimeri TaxID=1643 RepID=UPI00162A71F8|nr:Ig-like domain-containing protein [Listeria welshimeri]MBC2042023.1 LPXTG cell wall anchor domain-containing protein [Listeria welshimeri]MBF2505856.1 InlB B-repeat-containing protein [Listeria welshimeri]MBF2658277.1 InlB B-repeat-containing protein [Listeria welshimeri]